MFVFLINVYSVFIVLFICAYMIIEIVDAASVELLLLFVLLSVVDVCVSKIVVICYCVLNVFGVC